MARTCRKIHVVGWGCSRGLLYPALDDKTLFGFKLRDPFADTFPRLEARQIAARAEALGELEGLFAGRFSSPEKGGFRMHFNGLIKTNDHELVPSFLVDRGTEYEFGKCREGMCRYYDAILLA